MSDETIADLTEKADYLKQKADFEMETLKDVILNGRVLMFETNRKQLSKSVLGEFYEINMKS